MSLTECTYAGEVYALFDEELPEERLGEVRDHIANCPLCRSLSQDLLETREAMRQAHASAGLSEEAWQRIRREIERALEGS